MTELIVTYHGTYESKEGREYGWIEDCFKTTVRDDIAKGLIAEDDMKDSNTAYTRTIRKAKAQLKEMAKARLTLYFMTIATRNETAKVYIGDIRQTDHYMNEGECY